MIEQFERKSIDIIGKQLHYLEYGNSADSEYTLLCIHGVSLHASVWLPSMSDILKKNRHVVLVDLWDHGLSDSLTMEEMTAYYLTHFSIFLQQFHPNPIIGMGHSFGGFLLSYWASKYPEYITDLILLDPSIFAKEFLPFKDEAHDLFKNYDRKKSFDSFIEIEAYFQKKYSRWNAEVMSIFLEHGVIQKEGKCFLRNQNERNYYLWTFCTANEIVYELFPQVSAHILLLECDSGSLISSEGRINFHGRIAPLNIADYFVQAKTFKEIILEDSTHFLVMDNPKQINTYLKVYSPTHSCPITYIYLIHNILAV